MNEIVSLIAPEAALEWLSTDFLSFSPAENDFEWLVGGVWLRTKFGVFLATAGVTVLADGQVVRPLELQSSEDMLAQVAAEIPFINDHLQEHASSVMIESPPLQFLPVVLKPWRAETYTMHIVIRNWRCRARARALQSASALLFTSGGGARLLVGTDVASLAMVLSEDLTLIEAYLDDCQLMSVADYFSCNSANAIPSNGS